MARPDLGAAAPSGSIVTLVGNVLVDARAEHPRPAGGMSLRRIAEEVGVRHGITLSHRTVQTVVRS